MSRTHRSQQRPPSGLRLAASRRRRTIPPSPSASSCPMPPAAAPTPWRAISPRDSRRRFGQPFVVENRPGSGTTIGANFVAKSAPDGQTILLGTSSTFAIAVGLYKKLPYDPVTDFAPIALVAAAPFVLIVHPSLPVHSVADLVRYLKANPGFNYASGGVGSQHHVNAELFRIDGRHRHQERELSRRRPGGAGRRRRPCEDDVRRRRRLGARADPRRQAARAGGDHRASGSTPCRTSRPCTRPASPAMRPMPGSRSSRRPRRRAAIVARLNGAFNDILVRGDAKAYFSQARLAAARHHAGRARRPHQERDRALGQGDAGRRRRGRGMRE